MRVQGSRRIDAMWAVHLGIRFETLQALKVRAEQQRNCAFFFMPDERNSVERVSECEKARQFAAGRPTSIKLNRAALQTCSRSPVREKGAGTEASPFPGNLFYFIFIPWVSFTQCFNLCNQQENFCNFPIRCSVACILLFSFFYRFFFKQFSAHTRRGKNLQLAVNREPRQGSNMQMNLQRRRPNLDGLLFVEEDYKCDVTDQVGKKWVSLNELNQQFTTGVERAGKRRTVGRGIPQEGI